MLPLRPPSAAKSRLRAASSPGAMAAAAARSSLQEKTRPDSSLDQLLLGLATSLAPALGLWVRITVPGANVHGGRGAQQRLAEDGVGPGLLPSGRTAPQPPPWHLGRRLCGWVGICTMYIYIQYKYTVHCSQ